jgi:hypothetical protein
MSCGRSVKAYKDKTRIYSNHPPAMTSSVTLAMTQSTSCFAGNYLEALPADLSELIMSYSKATWRYHFNINLFREYKNELVFKLINIMDKDEYKELKTNTKPITSIHANNIFNKVMKELKALAPDVDKYIIIKEFKGYVSLNINYTIWRVNIFCDYEDYRFFSDHYLNFEENHEKIEYILNKDEYKDLRKSNNPISTIEAYDLFNKFMAELIAVDCSISRFGLRLRQSIYFKPEILEDSDDEGI